MASDTDTPDRPWASAQEEERLHWHFPFETMSPEEYAARNAAGIMCFSLHERRCRDAKLDAWIQRLAEILFDRNAVDECRRRFLTVEEIERELTREQEDF